MNNHGRVAKKSCNINYELKINKIKEGARKEKKEFKEKEK